jgi:hypothetical protein
VIYRFGLMETGIVDNRHKEIDPAVTVATMLSIPAPPLFGAARKLLRVAENRCAQAAYAIALKDRRLMGMAGLSETWRSPAGERIRSFTIITTPPNTLCASCITGCRRSSRPKPGPNGSARNRPTRRG